MPQPTQTPPPSWVDSLLQPLFDRLGLNGPTALQNTQKPKTPPPIKVDREDLKRKGWSDADIDWWIRTKANSAM